MTAIQLGTVDYAILLIYVAFVVGIGFAAAAVHEELVGLPHVRPLAFPPG